MVAGTSESLYQVVRSILYEMTEVSAPVSTNASIGTSSNIHVMNQQLDTRFTSPMYSLLVLLSWLCFRRWRLLFKAFLDKPGESVSLPPESESVSGQRSPCNLVNRLRLLFNSALTACCNL